MTNLHFYDLHTSSYKTIYILSCDQSVCYALIKMEEIKGMVGMLRWGRNNNNNNNNNNRNIVVSCTQGLYSPTKPKKES